jgi:hypothetical protein
MPIPIYMNGDFRGKDSFSLRCVDIAAKNPKSKEDQSEALSVVTEWRPIIRRDILHPDDIGSSRSIHYDPDDYGSFEHIAHGDRDKPDSLSVKAVQIARTLLGATSPTEERVPLSDEFIKALGTFEQMDVSAPLPPEKRVRIPSVHSSQNIWEYLGPEQQNQFAQNLQDTQSEGSYLVLGTTEAALPFHSDPDVAKRLADLDTILQGHGYKPEDGLNEYIKDRMESNSMLDGLNQRGALEYNFKRVKPFVYQKIQRDPAPTGQSTSRSIKLDA